MVQSRISNFSCSPNKEEKNLSYHELSASKLLLSSFIQNGHALYRYHAGETEKDIEFKYVRHHVIQLSPS